MIFQLILIASLLWGAEALEKKKIKFKNGAELVVEVADDFTSRNKGLMDRTEMPENHGMFFVFNSPRKLSFWMKNTYIPLSIAYLDENKVIKEIHKMKEQSLLERSQNLQHYPSRCDCQYALEVNQGWFKKNKVKVGEKIKLMPMKD